ncbi:structural maintenance of chromosomes protein 6 isoform X1 [Misgurnus anguillicaudatus]|uniref:structural maintenance of chromosomes protein 6 isoform X1 n=2 Tax=Misgurnus anguillicaudatus TaxID=75329 RepID=UPI0024353052|nr:structural maintenance of chromosomes protein 6 isoform X1 [Misgurnus anguillicaudatus]XP_055027959.1 structural maintenance of chromosomes protein 6 isoform X1 [Misgurnus anguillicaudatus]XP_055027960.1 structural maintenance of chromosomes protein 6 isoform X1 [Misgurnus anguillicaudatus]
MNKRRSCVLDVVKPSKTPRTEGKTCVQDDMDVDEEDGGQQDQPLSASSVGDIGVIENITLKNFMNHHLLGPFSFGPNVNFIVGNNGSGKSAILTALIVGLGGKATTTNRGASLKGFVKYGESAADIKVKLKNRGKEAYKIETYGDSICIEHRITSDGCRTCKIKNKTGHVISTKKEELTAILDHFNIQVDNPVSILNQEMSKQFLHSKNETDKYKFFMKATLLEQMKRDYIHIKQTKAVTRDQVERQEECLKDLRQLFLQKKERYESLSSLDDLRRTLEDLKQKMAWCLVREMECQVEQLKEQIEREESEFKLKEKLELCQNKVSVSEKKSQEIQQKIWRLTEEQDSLAEESRKFKEEIKVKSKAQKNQEVIYVCAENKLKQLEKEQCLLQDRIHKINHSLRRSHEAEQIQRLKKISAFKKQLEKLEAESNVLNQEIKDKQQALLKGREEYDKLSMEEKEIQACLESKLKRKKQLMASRSNRLRRFGDSMPELLQSIDRAFAQGRFIKKPVGPIGACISLKDPSLVVAVESCLRSFMKTFCCDNYKDEKVLQELMSPYFPRGSRPQIIVCRFTDRAYKLQGRGVCHPEFPSVLDALNIENPVITNCLIDMRSIESILIIKEKARARKVMQGSRPPKNCREAFTAEGDQVFSNRYYTPENEVLVKYLGGDPEAEIRLVESEVENNQAQLSRFQLHLRSVKEDIQSMEEKLRSVIVTCKHNQENINKVKASITELENIEEPQTEDISSLEEDARENQQKIESQRRTVTDAQKDLKKHERSLMNINQQYKDVKNKMERLSDEVEQIKEEQVKAESEYSKLDQTMQVLTKKLKSHQDNIQTMRAELSLKEEETRAFEAKAKEICPERPHVNLSTKSIDVEITRLRQKINTHERNHGDKEQVIREYAEAHGNYKSKSNQLRDLKKFIDRLDNIMTDRQARYKILRRSLSVRCKLYFNNFMIKLQCCGSMMFDHNNETLSISVKPPGRENDSVSDMRSLSGGERSFSTVCFLLSLWEITESPFRCLDEFDVYMDMHNRQISLDLLLELSERQQLRQFIFITPQSTSNLPKSAHIKIHQLQDPERDTEENGH